MTDDLNWPRYQNHKVCQAAELAEIVTLSISTFQLIPRDSACEPLTVDPGFILLNDPQPGGYVIRNEDGSLGYQAAKHFSRDHHQLEGLHFGGALAALRSGFKVRRSGWNGAGLWLELQVPDEGSKMTLPYLYLNYPPDAKTTPGARVPWTPTQTDVLATDWEIVL